MGLTRVIANPHAGTGELGERLEGLANALGWEWCWTGSEGEASRLARDAAERGYERIVAAGGDGTVHLVVQGLIESSARPELAVLPLGTGNDLLRTLGFPSDPEVVMEVLAAGTEQRTIDLARARIGPEERILINGSAAGFSGEVDRALDPDAKARWGAWAYMRAALEVIGDLPRYELQVRIDGRDQGSVACIGLTVMNGQACGGGMMVAPTASLEDGLLDLMIVEEASTFTLATVAAQLRTGGILDNKYVRHHRGARIELVSEPVMPFNVDGELLGDVHRASFAVLPRALRIAVGPGYAFPSPSLSDARPV